MKPISYPKKEDGSLDLIALFEERFEKDAPAGLYEDLYLRSAKAFLGELELRRKITSEQTAEVAVMMAEVVCGVFQAQAMHTKKLVQIDEGVKKGRWQGQG